MAKKSETKGKIISGWSVGGYGTEPKSTFRSFFNYYKKSSNVYRVINEISQTVGKGWFDLLDSNGEQVEDRNVMEILNYYQSFDKFKTRIVRDINVTGNAFILKLKNVNWQLIWLQVLDPRTIRILADPYGEVVKYFQAVQASYQEFEPDEIVHFYDELDPDNEIFGMSPMEWIIIDVMADTESGLSNYYFFKNSAIPSQLFVLEPWMTKEQIKSITAQLKQNFSWGQNKHKNWAIVWVKDIKQLQPSLKDMEFETLRKFNIEKVCAAYWVPKIILWYTDSVNYSNAEVQYQRFIENTIRPREKKIEELVTNIIREINPNLRIEFVDDHIDDLDKRLTVIEKQISLWLMTPNEARKELWYETFSIPEADQPLISKNLDLLSDVWLSAITPMNANT